MQTAGPRRRRQEGRSGSALKWFPWFLGIAILAAVVLIAFHSKEQLQFLELVRHARPLWMLWAILLQSLTYLSQGEVWRMITRAAGSHVSLAKAYKLSLTKLFVDQAIPSAGISGTVAITKGLEKAGVPRSAVASGVVVSTTSYYIAYLMSLAAALYVAASRGHAHTFILVISLLFALFAVGLTWTVLSLPGRQGSKLARTLKKIPVVRKAIKVISEAKPELTHNPKLLLGTTALQLSIILLDVATMVCLLRSLSVKPSIPGVFASFMLSTLLRDVGIIPGGLGIYEAASVITLKLAGIPVAAALPATLLYRGLSFWLPMVPGIVFSRSAVRGKSK